MLWYICLITGRFIYAYLGTGVYAVKTTAGSFEDLRDHGMYINTTSILCPVQNLQWKLVVYF